MVKVVQQQISLEAIDGFSLAATVFQPKDVAPDRALVIGSALGVPRYFYYKFALFFQHDFAVITFDYRGIFESTDNTLSGSAMKMEHWGCYDIETALRYVKEDLQISNINYFGHSCGGQLVSLAPSSPHINDIIFVAGQSGNWKLWPWPYNVGVYLTWQNLSATAPFLDYVPTKLLGISSLIYPAVSPNNGQDGVNHPSICLIAARI